MLLLGEVIQHNPSSDSLSDSKHVHRSGWLLGSRYVCHRDGILSQIGVIEGGRRIWHSVVNADVVHHSTCNYNAA
jgi:hypothetical protein